jgi:hypothetical protein
MFSVDVHCVYWNGLVRCCVYEILWKIHLQTISKDKCQGLSNAKIERARGREPSNAKTEIYRETCYPRNNILRSAYLSLHVEEVEDDDDDDVCLMTTILAVKTDCLNSGQKCVVSSYILRVCVTSNRYTMQMTGNFVFFLSNN